MDIRIFVLTLLVISTVGIFARMLRISPTPFLVLTGMMIASTIAFPALRFDPHFLLTVLIPPLLFEGSIRLSLEQLKKTGWGIFLLACPGVVLSVLILGPLFHYLFTWSLPVSCLFASLLAATDPVAVLDTFRTTKVSHRLTTLIEGESLFNDGTAMLLFGIFLTLAKSPDEHFGIESLNFVWMSLGGIAVGAIVGLLFSALSRIRFEQELRISLSTVLAYGVYLLADSLHLSGLLAVVAAGIVYANVFSKHLTIHFNRELWDFWSYLGFLTSSIIFLLIGTQVNVHELHFYWGLALEAYGLLLGARLLILLISFFISARLGERFSWSWLFISWWGGLRGALSLALAMSLIGVIPEGRSIYFITIVIVILFVFINGWSSDFLISRFGSKLNLKEGH